MCDFDIITMVTTFFDKLLTENNWLIEWFLTPVVNVPFVDTSPAMILVVSMFIVLAVKITEMIRIMFTQIKMIFGDVLIAILWIYYTVFGHSDKSVMLITKDEAKAKMHMYLVIAVVIAIVAAGMMLPNLISPVNTASDLVINNSTVDTGDMNYLLELIIP